MSRKLEFWRTITRMVFQCIFTILVMHTILYNYAEHPYHPGCVIVVIALFIISYVIRFKIQNVALIVLGHLAFAGIVFLFGFEISATITLVLITIIMMALAIVFDKKEGIPVLSGGPVGMGLAAFGVMFYANYKELDSLLKEAYFIPALMIVLYFIMVYLDGLKGYMISTSKITGIPMGRLLVTNSVFVGSLLFMFLVSVVIVGLLFGDDNALFLAQLIGLVFVIIIGGFIYLTGNFVRLFTKEPSMKSDEEFKERLKDVVPESSGDFIETLIKIAIVIGILFVLYRVIRMLAKWILARKQNGLDLVEFANVDVDVNEQVENQKDEKRTLFASPEQKIRKLYRDRVIKHKAYIDISRYKTARNYESILREEGVDELKDATDLYASVRYGTLEPNRETVRKMKEALKKNR